MTKLLALLVFILALGFISGCGSEDDPVNPPQNLTLTADVSEDGSGEVVFTASADNAAYYEFKFGDNPAAAPKKVTNGIAEYAYEESGSYTVKVTAFANKDISTSTTKDITVVVFFTIPTKGYTTPPTRAGYVSYWADEFNGDALNEGDWTFEIGDGCPNVCGWGNNELEYYKKQNTSLVDGHLVITAKAESAGTRNYTSSRIITLGKKSVKYGRIDARALLPKGKGIWPAIWMLGNNITTVSWPMCGEIDIMEMIGGAANEKTAHGTAHFYDNGNKNISGHYDLPSGILADEFHVYSIIWTEEKITWFIDDIQFHEVLITSERAEFKEEFFFIMNVAVGGNWPGQPDQTLKFPQRMIVDYIRVFKPE